MMNKKVEEAINSQINYEFYSSYLYLSMSAYFTSVNLKGFANWMNIQAQEELMHGMKMYQYILSRNGIVTLQPLSGPETTWKSTLDVFEKTYAHELTVTSRIHAIADLAMQEKDHATSVFIQWFINEQVEEESNDTGIIDELKMIADSREGLFMLDRELATRVFAMPPGLSLFGVAPTAAGA